MEARYTRRNMTYTSQMQNKLLQKREGALYPAYMCAHTVQFPTEPGHAPRIARPYVRPCFSELIHSLKFTSSYAHIYIFKEKNLH